MAFIPSPDQFPSWQEWARHVVEVLADSGIDGAAPELSGTPPIEKILLAARGNYELLGQDVEFRVGARFYEYLASTTSYTLTGGDAELLVTTQPPLTAETGSYALTGNDAGLTSGTALPTQGTAVTTFHSIGLYWQPPSVPLNNAVKIRYRRATDATWRQGHDLWYDSRAVGGRPVEARGSIVHCTPGTEYIVQFGMQQSNGSTSWIAQLRATTWSENFPIGTRMPVWSGVRSTQTSRPSTRSGISHWYTLLIDRSGTPNGYTLYDFTGQNATAQAPNSSSRHCVIIDADYVILRGLKCVGGGDAAIWINPTRHDIIIEDCDISGFGRDSGTFVGSPVNGNRAISGDCAIMLQPDSRWGPQTTRRVIIQRNRIHNPAFGSNSWDYGHPLGCTAIMCDANVGGNHVIRYNAIYSTSNGEPDGGADTSKFFEDALIMSGQNDSYTGAPGPDTDIYKNIVRHCMDDAMEPEGGAMNVRIWSNYLDHVGVGFGSAVCSIGPIYIWRNVLNRTRFNYLQNPWGNDGGRGVGFKFYNRSLGNGRRYIYHNTCLQMGPGTNEGPTTLGVGRDVVSGGGTTQPVANTWSRNNILDMQYTPGSTPTGIAIRPYGGSNNNFDYDMTNSSNMGVNEPNGRTAALARYKTGHGAQALATGRYQLLPGTAGHNDGALINNFNNDVDAPHQYLGSAPDRGAHEEGSADMAFGPTATGS